MISDKKKMVYLIILAIFFIILDRFFKILALKGVSFDIIGSFFTFNLSKNYYIAFSLPLGGWILNILIIVLIIIMLIFWLKLAENKKYFEAGFLVIIILGALSNLFDRFKYGFVIDYFDLKYWPIFNIADIMIVGGAIGLVILYLKNNKK